MQRRHSAWASAGKCRGLLRQAERAVTAGWEDGDGRGGGRQTVACVMLSALLYSLLMLAAVTAGCCDQKTSRPLVATREGLIRGVIGRSAAGRLFYSFKGIRYARAPVGALRFQPPQRHPGWSGVADGLSHGSRCVLSTRHVGQ